MNERFKQIHEWAGKHKALIWAGGGLFFIFIIVVSSKDKPATTATVVTKSRVTEKNSKAASDNSGLFLGETVDRKAFVGRLEEQYHQAQGKTRLLENRLDVMDKKFLDLIKSQGEAQSNIIGLEEKLAAAQIKTGSGDNAGNSAGGVDPVSYRLEVVNISSVSELQPDGVFLPAGSFVRCTLLTGVYAPVDQNNPLPVLIRLNEAFYGPNEIRVPLEGSFVIGKASGDLNSERALVQAVTLSTVNSDGREFQHQGNIGYVTDVNGQLGIKGRVVHNTGGQLAAAFMTGFLGGGSMALADGETTSVASPGGRVSRNVTGNAGRHAAFQGLSQSSAQLSQYYADRAKTIVPAIQVDAGVEVYLVILEGVRINGLKRNKFSDIHYWD